MEGKLRFTRGKDGSAHIIYLLDENENLPAEIQVKGFIPAKGAKINLMGGKGSSLKWKSETDHFVVQIPENQRKNLPSPFAVVLKVNQLAD
jgi:hypothetical protein